jgi:hypothetical protein
VSQRHVKLNGIWYPLAESAEGTHYNMALEPLRVPNASVVQGDTGKFQLRPDQILWTLTDWSGGEGQLKWDPTQPNRSYLLQGVDPFTRPGNLTVGFKEELAQLQTGGDFTDDGIHLGYGRETLFAIPDDTHIVYEWDAANDYFKTGVVPTAGSGGCPNDTICGDYDAMFFVDANVDIIKFTSGSVWSQHNDQIGSAAGVMRDLGPYLYYLVTGSGKLYELSKATANTTTPETELYAFQPSEPNLAGSVMVAADNRLYFFTNETGFITTIHEVVPTTAAGAGYGRELARIEGIRTEAIWFQGGVVYFLGVDATPDSATTVGPERFLMYLQPDGAYGTLGSVRGLVRTPTDHGISPANEETFSSAYAVSGRLSRTAFLIPPTSEDQDEDDVAQGLFEVDGVSGGYAAVARYPTTVTTRPTGERGLLYHDGYYFAFDDDLDKVHLFNVQAYTDQVGEAVSPAHDMGLASEKVLERIEIVCEPLPASTSITIGYSIDGAAWVDASIASTTNDTGGVLQISTDSSTIKYRSLRVRVQLTPNSGNSPELKAINVYSRVNRRVRTWNLLLDASDDAAPSGYTGAQMEANILALNENTVLPFIDRYRSHDSESGGTEYDVVLDSAQLVNSQPGEGIIAVTLTEVV